MIADTVFNLNVVSVGAISVSLVGLNATLIGGPLVLTLTAPNTAQFPLDTIELLVTTGVLSLDAAVLEEPSEIPTEDLLLGFDPGTIGTIVTTDLPNGNTAVTVTLPLVHLESTTESGITIDLDFNGAVVLEGTVPPLPVPIFPYLIR